MEKLKKLFNPNTIAVIGATGRQGHVGYDVMKNLIGNGYEGTVYPVNPNRKSVLGVKTYSSVREVPDKIDLAVIITPAATVPAIAEECGKAGVAGLVIISAGFKEAGEEGRGLFLRLQETIRRYDMRMLGPNCLGFLRPSLNLNASFSPVMAAPGKIAFISQSGALGTAILDWARKQNVGFSHFVSVGSMADIDFDDLIDYFGQDPGTSSILIYMESLENARRFLSAARAFARTKPIVILKAGKSSEGAKAALSHTGSLTGNDSVFDAAFKRAGVLRVNTIGELFDCAQTLSMQRRPRSNRLAIVTNAGGPGVIATDYLIEKGGTLAGLSEETLGQLNEVLPATWSRANPVDVLGDAGRERYEAAVRLCLEDDNVDGVLVILTPQTMTHPAEVAAAVIAAAKKYNKIVLASWMGAGQVEEGRECLRAGNIPVYAIPENAVRSFLNLYQYGRNLQLLYETPPTIPEEFTPATEENRRLIREQTEAGRSVLTGSDAKRLLANYGIPVLENVTVHSAGEAAAGAAEIGYPAVMKIVSQDIPHKTDVGGVQLNIRSPEEARKAYEVILSNVGSRMPEARVEGVLIEPMLKKNHELLIGAKRDPIFGPVIVFGMGGIAVEIFKDTNVGLPPLNMALAERLIEETKIYKLLKGFRGLEGVDLSSMKYLLCKFAYLIMDFPEIKEIDINPFAVDAKGGVVLDAKVVLDPDTAQRQVKPYSHLVISPYPKEYEKKVTVVDGREVLLRPIKPEDEPMEAEMFTHFSEDTQRLRFFTLIKDITHEMLIRYTQIDYDREIAIIAEISEDNKRKMAGVVRLIADPFNETAEFAIVVADPWQKQGLGNVLTDYMLEIAEKRKIRKVYAQVLPDNSAMLHIFHKRHFNVQRKEDVCCAELELSGAVTAGGKYDF